MAEYEAGMPNEAVTQEKLRGLLKVAEMGKRLKGEQVLDVTAYVQDDGSIHRVAIHCVSEVVVFDIVSGSFWVEDKTGGNRRQRKREKFGGVDAI